MVEILKKKYQDSMFMGFLVILITILANFFLVKWALIDAHYSFQEKRFTKLLRATDHLFTALEHSEKSPTNGINKNKAFISRQLSLAREELMSEELKALRIRLVNKKNQ